MLFRSLRGVTMYRNSLFTADLGDLLNRLYDAGFMVAKHDCHQACVIANPVLDKRNVNNTAGSYRNPFYLQPL